MAISRDAHGVASGSEDYWNLVGGTQVVTSNSETNNLPFGETGKVDLMVYGKLNTFKGQGSDSMAVFRSVAMDSVNGDDWHGVTVDHEGSGSVISSVDIGFAKFPLTVYYVDSLTTIRNSRIHHFEDTGIWVKGSLGQGAVVESVRVERGSKLDFPKGSTGIFADGADELDLRGNDIRMDGFNNAAGAEGIHFHWGKTFCLAPAPSPRSVLITKNYVRGPGNAIQTPADYRGVWLNWLCGSTNRAVTVSQNYIEEWQTAGLDVLQTQDIQVSCNYCREMRDAAVEVYRDLQITGPAVRFTDNKLEALQDDEAFHSVGANDVAGLSMGPYTAGQKGKNRLMVDDTDTRLVDTNTSTGSLPAKDNYWFLERSSQVPQDTVQIRTPSFPSDGSAISSRLTGSASVDFANWDQDAGALPSCFPVRPSGAPQLATWAPPGVAVLPEEEEEPVRSAGVGSAVALGWPYPNPSRGTIELGLVVRQEVVGECRMEVFDVRGRRVLESVRQLSPGALTVGWAGHDGQGRPVGPGIYFLRLTAPGIREVRKVTIVR
ncbi:MAG: T9SS type A sorting domain-containing protein [Candidatus Eiseniibacteriota bacterium]